VEPDYTKSDQITVVVADDQQLVRAGFRLILDGEPDMTVIGEAQPRRCPARYPDADDGRTDRGAPDHRRN
jgi:DNA-binding NarL/FixJ family response regulator